MPKYTTDAQIMRRRFERKKKTKKFRIFVEVSKRRQDGKCFYCKESLYKKQWIRYYQDINVLEDRWVFDVDHVRPLGNGGTNDFDNLVLSCKECNNAKGQKYESA